MKIQEKVQKKIEDADLKKKIVQINLVRKKFDKLTKEIILRL